MRIGVSGWDIAAVVAVILIVPIAIFWPMFAGAALAAIVIAAIAFKAPERMFVAGAAVALAASAGVGVRALGGERLAYTELRYLSAGLAFLLASVMLPRVLAGLGRQLWLLVLVVLALLSLAWSHNVTSSAIALGGWASMILIGAVLATRYGRQHVVRLLLWVFGVASAVSLALAYVVPSIGRVAAPRPDGTVEQMPVGLFGWNSELGLVSGVAAVLAFSGWLKGRSKKAFFLTALMVAVTFVSTSATSLLAMAAGFVAVLWVAVPKVRVLLGVGAFAALILWLTGGIAAVEAWVLSLVGRTPDLTGRSYIWNIVLDMAHEKPVFGYGIGGAPDLASILGFSAHAHNGYLQLLLEFGYVGLAVFTIAAVVAIVRVVRLGDPVLAGVLIVFLVSNTANNFLVTANVAVALFAWVAVSATVSKREPAPVVPEPAPAAQLPAKRSYRLQRRY